MKFASQLMIILFVLLFFSTSCEKWRGDADGDVELYLLESYETEDQTFAIVNSSVKIKKDALIAYSDFKSYNSRKHIFKITSGAAELVKDQDHSVHGLAFAVVANDKVVYTGYFWPAYSSMGCQWIVIDPLMMFGENELRVELGYPGQVEGVDIPDERNNELILDIFRRDGKLKN
jgi:hypothetical protein